MDEALLEAKKALEYKEVPIGAVVVFQGQIIASSYNQVCKRHDQTAHAEILALQAASKHLGSEYLSECDLYVTLEPCAMCAMAISLFHVRRLYFGAYNPKEGAVDHPPYLYNFVSYKPEVYGGIEEKKCAEILKVFFANLRTKPDN